MNTPFSNSTSTQSDTSAPQLSFEQAIARLEIILEKLNSGATPLEESLILYEEADQLILSCNKRLNEAERKIETLIKNRNGDLSLGVDQKPLSQEFTINTSAQSSQ